MEMEPSFPSDASPTRKAALRISPLIHDLADIPRHIAGEIGRAGGSA
jgi:hypothetical protein